jgi:hypothetical protein
MTDGKIKDKRKYGEITDRLTAPVLRDLYLSQEKSLQEIADACGCTRQMVDLLMAKYCINRRERIFAVKLAGKKGKFVGRGEHRKPQVCRSQDKRAELRSTYPYAVQYTVDPGLTDERLNAMCADISNSGACIYVYNKLEAGQKITFKGGIPVPHGDAKVRWCSRISGNVYKAGLIFSEPGETSNPAGDLTHSNFPPVTL